MATATVPYMTNVEFGARIGVHFTTASRYRNGERLPSAPILARIFTEFKVSNVQRRALTDMLDRIDDRSERLVAFSAWLRDTIVGIESA